MLPPTHEAQPCPPGPCQWPLYRRRGRPHSPPPPRCDRSPPRRISLWSLHYFIITFYIKYILLKVDWLFLLCGCVLIIQV